MEVLAFEECLGRFAAGFLFDIPEVGVEASPIRATKAPQAGIFE
jgi:hypothetical protein